MAQQIEGKFIYEKAAVGCNHAQIKQALDLLIMAGLVYPVTHSSANGIPLGAEIDMKYRRMVLLKTAQNEYALRWKTSDVLTILRFILFTPLLM